MEGTGETLTSTSSTIGRVARRAGFVCKGLLPALLVAEAMAIAGEEQFLVVEYPERLWILNSYQQAPAMRERMVFQPFVPMRILKPHDVLGDGMTACMRIEAEGMEFFLIRENDGRMAGESQAGFLMVFSGTLRGDTLRVTPSMNTSFTSPDERAVGMLKAGERVVALFAARQKVYIKRLGPPAAFGWATLPPAMPAGKPPAPLPGKKLSQTVTHHLADSVRAVISRTNLQLAQLFAFFNSTSPTTRTTPQWHMDITPAFLRCSLRDASLEREFPVSARYLAKDLERIVHGTGFEVVLSGEDIIIRPL